MQQDNDDHSTTSDTHDGRRCKIEKLSVTGHLANMRQRWPRSSWIGPPYLKRVGP
jgi:hypothetical protein